MTVGHAMVDYILTSIGVAMAGLTDRSQIPLKPSDFKVIHGERRLSDVRLAERLGFGDASDLRTLTKRWESFLENKSGKPLHRAEVSRARGPAGLAYWYTIPELIFIAGQSKAKNAADVQYEAALIAAYWVQGERPPDDAAPTLRALAAPDRPQLVQTRPATVDFDADIPADEVQKENPLIGVKSPATFWGKPLKACRGHHIRTDDGKVFTCRRYLNEQDELAELWLYSEKTSSVNMREVFPQPDRKVLLRWDSSITPMMASELMRLDCFLSPALVEDVLTYFLNHR